MSHCFEKILWRTWYDWTLFFESIVGTAEQSGKSTSLFGIEALSYHERCSLLNLNPVIIAKHFQYWVETFFRDVLLANANPISIEFQITGSPHLHALICTSDCPELSKDTKNVYIDYVHQHNNKHTSRTKKQIHNFMTWWKHTRHTITVKLVKSITMFHVDLILDSYLLTKPLLLNHWITRVSLIF